MSYTNPQPVQVVTPTGSTFDGESIDTEGIVAISIIRAGDSLLDCFTKIAPGATVGKILIQRDEETRLPVLFYSKLPPLQAKKILVLDPMLATGGSAKAAIQVALDNGAREEDIIFLNVVSCPEGIANLLAAYPAIRIVTGSIDSGLNEKVCPLFFIQLGCVSLMLLLFDCFSGVHRPWPGGLRRQILWHCLIVVNYIEKYCGDYGRSVRKKCDGVI